MWRRNKKMVSDGMWTVKQAENGNADKVEVDQLDNVLDIQRDRKRGGSTTPAKLMGLWEVGDRVTKGYHAATFNVHYIQDPHDRHLRFPRRDAGANFPLPRGSFALERLGVAGKRYSARTHAPVEVASLLFTPSRLQGTTMTAGACAGTVKRTRERPARWTTRAGRCLSE